jgi:acyl-coenzyme A thioesterase PaaI-like protein
MATPAQLFQSFSRYPLGRQLFSRAVTRRAPYFASVSPLIQDLRPGRCEIRVRNRRAVHNHIGTVHAIAMCNMCELAAGLMIDSSLPRGLRWIPRGMTVRYLKKAETDLSAVVETALDFPAGFRGDVLLPVKVSDAAGQVVMEADISMYVSPKKSD